MRNISIIIMILISLCAYSQEIDPTLIPKNSAQNKERKKIFKHGSSFSIGLSYKNYNFSGDPSSGFIGITTPSQLVNDNLNWPPFGTSNPDLYDPQEVNDLIKENNYLSDYATSVGNIQATLYGGTIVEMDSLSSSSRQFNISEPLYGLNINWSFNLNSNMRFGVLLGNHWASSSLIGHNGGYKYDDAYDTRYSGWTSIVKSQLLTFGVQFDYVFIDDKKIKPFAGMDISYSIFQQNLQEEFRQTTYQPGVFQPIYSWSLDVATGNVFITPTVGLDWAVMPKINLNIGLGYSIGMLGQKITAVGNRGNGLDDNPQMYNADHYYEFKNKYSSSSIFNLNFGVRFDIL